MAIVSRKISSFPNLPKLSGEEFIMVAYNGKSYKIPICENPKLTNIYIRL